MKLATCWSFEVGSANTRAVQRCLNLEQLLERVSPSDERELGYRDQMLALLRNAPQPSRVFCREHYLPGHFTASAFVLAPRGDALLLIHHSKLGRWLQPGGHVEPTDRDILAASLREAREEVGLSDLEPCDAGIFDLDIHAIPARGEAPEHAHYDVRFLFRAPHEHYRAGSDALAAQWVPLSEIHRLESDDSVMRAVRKLRGR